MANSPARSLVDVGSVIADTYTIEALIGRGGMGAVFVASHNRLPGKKVAIKLLHAELTDDDVVARFRREAMIASQLDHPNIVGVTDFNVTADGTPYLVLEYLHGQTLAQRLKPGPLALDETLSIIRQIGSAVAAAHREGIVHRDLKPQNIFLVPTEVAGHRVEIAKVLDFGISKIRGSQTVKTQESTLLGTPQYMAPEQATGQHASVDQRTDVFALGAIVYEMLSGQPAFSGASIPEVVFKVVYEAPVPLAQLAPDLPAAITAAVDRAMAKPADERFPSVSDFVEALTGVRLAPLRRSSITPPVVGFATGSRHDEATHDATNKALNDALAKTMDSVDRAPAGPDRLPPVSAQAPTVESQRVPAASGAAQAPTVESQRVPAPAVASPPATTGADPALIGASPPATTGVAAAPRRRSVGLIVALAVGCAAIATAAAVAAYLAMRRPDPTQPVVATDAAAARPATPPLALATGDAGVVAVDRPRSRRASDGRPPDAAIAHPDAARPARGRPVPSAPTDDGEPDDDSARGQLDQADAALAQGQYDRAERLANTVINSQGASARQRAHAHAVHGAVECAQRNNREGAQIDLRSLRGRPKLRRVLIGACAKAGIVLR